MRRRLARGGRGALRLLLGHTRRRRLPRALRIGLLFVLVALTLASMTAQGQEREQPDAGGERHGVPGVQDHGVSRAQLEAEGERLFEDGCASCHGQDARGREGRAPSLRGVGEASADFYLRTGRMPLDDPEDQPRRSESPYTEREIDALIAYVGSFGGPPIPPVDADAGDLADGLKLFGEYCMACHQVVGQGGIAGRGVVPDLQTSEPVDVAEAIEVGPYVMPRFPHLDEQQVDSIARYVEWTEDPVDAGGWGLGHLGPVPEGMVTWLFAAFSLLLFIRLIGERTTE